MANSSRWSKSVRYLYGKLPFNKNILCKLGYFITQFIIYAVVRTQMNKTLNIYYS